MTIEHKITERFYYTAFSVRFFYEIIAKHMLKPTKKGIWHKWQKETWNCLYPLYLYGEWAFKKSWMNTFLLSLLIPLCRSSFAFKVELSASNSLFVFGICNSEVQEILGLFLSYKPVFRVFDLSEGYNEGSPCFVMGWAFCGVILLPCKPRRRSWFVWSWPANHWSA